MKRSTPEPTKEASTIAAAAAAKKPKTADQQSPPATDFGGQLTRMVDNPLCADVQLLVGQEATPVYASKVILVARSPVFEALLGGNFREGQPPPSPSISRSSSSSLETWALSLAPVFWHRAEIQDMEPRTMRHLLHCLYTDQLHPDLTDNDNDSTYPTQQAQDLVALYVAADRYLVAKAQTLVRKELVRRCDDAGDDYNVLPVFDLALAVAPELAASAYQSIIEEAASLFLGKQDEDIEAQWLSISDAAAARVVGMDLEGIDEIDVFRAVQRRYEHHLAEAEAPGDDDNGDGKNKKTPKKREAASAEAKKKAKKKVVGLIKGIKTKLMSVDELTEIVEPSGLFTNTQLISAFRDAALTHRFLIQEIKGSHNLVDFFNDGKRRWTLEVQETNTAEHSHTVHLRIKSGPEGSLRLPNLSAEGVTITIYCDRYREEHFCATASTAVPVPGVISVPFTAPPESGRVTILVRVPPTAFTKPVQK